MSATQAYPWLAVRPYELLCTLCYRGEAEGAAVPPRIAMILEAVRTQPQQPITVTCNAGDIYGYQEPSADEAPGGRSEYQRKRDLDVLQRLDLLPGSTFPARVLFMRLLKTIPSVAGLCSYETTTGPAWAGCPRATGGSYERACEEGITALIPPRDKDVLTAEKQASMQALCDTDEASIRPHILLCAVCQYGGGTRPPFEPDNLPDLMQMIFHEGRKLRIKLVQGADWMMCAPCPSLIPEVDGCVCGRIGSGGLYNELKDLNMLQRLGLTYGTSMDARELFKLVFEKIPTVAGVCALHNWEHPPYSVWWDPCGTKTLPSGYEKGRDELLALLT